MTTKKPQLRTETEQRVIETPAQLSDGDVITIGCESLDYVCKSCKESIAPTLDDPDDWGKCPHCENRHDRAVKQQNGRGNLVFITGVLSIFTIIGVFIAPLFFLIGFNSARKTEQKMRDERNRIGHAVDEPGASVSAVSDLIRDGWVIKDQTPTGFRLKQTDYGTRKRHTIYALLFFWTFGWANVFHTAFSSANAAEITVETTA
jgi:DNA-directed RNA polymerase subunit RPC12/RpoP